MDRDEITADQSVSLISHSGRDVIQIDRKSVVFMNKNDLRSKNVH